MALASRLRAIQAQQSVDDIAKNLSSLQFESALLEEEKKLLMLRARSHAVSVAHCALATVIVDIFNRSRKSLLDTANQDKQRTASKVHNDEVIDSLAFGIIGCGHLGRQIAQCLLTYGQLHPNRLKISTRRPETLKDLQGKGVQCYFNNKRLVSSVHVVILCVLPSQMIGVEDEIRDSITPSHIFICPVSSLSARRLCQMLNSTNIIRPVLHWSSGSPETHYNHSIDVNMALRNGKTVLGTCPIGIEKGGLIVSTDHRLTETIILAVVNLCTDQGLSLEQTLAVVHTAVFGESHVKPLTCEKLVPCHFGVDETLTDNNKCFPYYNLVVAFENETPLSQVLQENESIQKAFASRYCQVFEDYIQKQTFGRIK